MIPEEFKKLLPKVGAEVETGLPIYFLWIFDPQKDETILEHNEGRHTAEHVDHQELARRVPHPERVHGYAYKIKDGWRITDWEHRPVDDPHIQSSVRRALRKEGAHRLRGGSAIQSRAVKSKESNDREISGVYSG